jgi:hypothetical protein
VCLRRPYGDRVIELARMLDMHASTTHRYCDHADGRRTARAGPGDVQISARGDRVSGLDRISEYPATAASGFFDRGKDSRPS